MWEQGSQTKIIFLCFFYYIEKSIIKYYIMNIILLSIFWMLWYGVFDYLIASPSRKIKSLQLIFILTGINSIGLFIVFLFFWEWWYFGKEIIYPILAWYIGHLGVYFYSKSLVTGKIWISSSVANAYPLATVFLWAFDTHFHSEILLSFQQ